MKFVIGEQITNPDGYYLEIETMEGDADGYETIKRGPFQDEKVLEELITLLDKMQTTEIKNQYWDNDNTYYFLPEFKKWFINEDDDEEWPRDIYSGQFHNSLYKYEITFVKDNKIFQVEREEI